MKKIIPLYGFLLLVFIAKAQTGSIEGKVTDQDGAAIRSVTLTVFNNSGSKTGKSARSDAEGNYKIRNLAPGKYAVQYSCKGYAPLLQRGILVTAGKPAFIDIKLMPGRK